MDEPQPLPQILSPCSSGRRSIHSPEFEFWMVKNPSFPQPNLLSADELFSDGFLLPLHNLPRPQDPETSIPEPEPENVQELPDSNPANSTLTTNSKRWRHIFRKNGKKTLDSSVISSNSTDDHCNNEEKDVSVNKEKKREKKNGGAFGVGVSSNIVVSAAELNINIWPFSRSRSAGNGGARPRTAAVTRKVSSAPCSRSNSTGESKSRKWPNSPSRAGVHLGRSSPVWQVRRGGVGRSSEAIVKNAEKGLEKDGNECRRKIPAAVAGGGGAKARVLNLNVPMCIGYRPHLSCKTDENSAVSIAGGGGDGTQIGTPGEGVRRGNLFNIKSLFTKKVY